MLNRCYDLVNLSGYVAEIFDRDNEKDLLFIADEPNEDYLHDGSAVFDKTYFSGRCLWVFENEVTITPIGGLYIYMTMMPRDRALTILTDNQLKRFAKGDLK